LQACVESLTTLITKRRTQIDKVTTTVRTTSIPTARARHPGWRVLAGQARQGVLAPFRSKRPAARTIPVRRGCDGLRDVPAPGPRPPTPPPGRRWLGWRPLFHSSPAYVPTWANVAPVVARVARSVSDRLHHAKHESSHAVLGVCCLNKLNDVERWRSLSMSALFGGSAPGLSHVIADAQIASSIAPNRSSSLHELSRCGDRMPRLVNDARRPDVNESPAPTVSETVTSMPA